MKRKNIKRRLEKIDIADLASGDLIIVPHAHGPCYYLIVAIDSVQDDPQFLNMTCHSWGTDPAGRSWNDTHESFETDSGTFCEKGFLIKGF
jgi:hypothetical protein